MQSEFLSLRLVRSASGESAKADNPSEKERFPTSGNDNYYELLAPLK
ncbi:MAG: hypothetical protein WC594_07285 [Thermodesulfovibrionales bacterium]